MKMPSVKAWADAFDDVLERCVPMELREQVLSALVEKERARIAADADRPAGAVLIKASDIVLTPHDFPDERTLRYERPIHETVSLMIQIMVRSITSNHSREDAAKLLFREHRYGTGSRWLPHYLDGLPGIAVDLKKCAAIAHANAA